MAAAIVHRKGKNLLQPGEGPYMGESGHRPIEDIPLGEVGAFRGADKAGRRRRGRDGVAKEAVSGARGG